MGPALRKNPHIMHQVFLVTCLHTIGSSAVGLGIIIMCHGETSRPGRGISREFRRNLCGELASSVQVGRLA